MQTRIAFKHQEMKFAPLKCITLALSLLAIALHTRAADPDGFVRFIGTKMETLPVDGEHGLEDFLVAYISATNAKDVEKIKAMCHPAFLAALKKFVEDTPAAPGQTKPAFDSMLLQKPVPANHPPFIVQRYLKDSPLPLAGFLDWPVPPTHFVQFTYETSPDHTITFMLQLAHLGDRWFVVNGIPSAESVKKMRGGN